MNSVILKALSSGDKLYCVFIDYEKCFDSINQENISTHFVKLLKSIYTSVKACVRYEHEFSAFIESKIGLKQGDTSSPLIFMMFVNDVIEHINSDFDEFFTFGPCEIILDIVCR